MKTAYIQFPAPSSRRGAVPIPSGGSAASSVERIRRHRDWYSFFRSIRIVLSGLVDRSAYQQISLEREISVVFTSQGPVVYRCGAKRL